MTGGAFSQAESASVASGSSLPWTHQSAQWPKFRALPATLSELITTVNMQMPVEVVGMFQCH